MIAWRLRSGLVAPTPQELTREKIACVWEKLVAILSVLPLSAGAV